MRMIFGYFPYLDFIIFSRIYSVHDELLYGVIIDEFVTSFDIRINNQSCLWG